MSFSLYLHIPFCRRHCPFCHFYRLPDGADWKSYLQAVKRELDSLFPGAPSPVRTLYVGGGTPTLFPARFFDGFFLLLRERFDLSGLEEATVETDGDVAREGLEGLAEAGFSRVSIGVKSFLGRTRKMLGLEAPPDPDPVSPARAAGFSSVSVDLVYGMEGQLLEDLEEDLGAALAAYPDHVSLYSLEEGSSGPRQGDPDTAAAMFRHSRRTMIGAGFCQYEITNFARPGHTSRHNITYWQDGDFVGLGPSAHSCVSRDGVRVRWRNRPDLAGYLEDPPGCREELSREGGAGRAREALILGLRMNEGVRRAPFTMRYGHDPLRLLGGHLHELTQAGLVRFDASRIRLTTRGMLLSNEVFLRVMDGGEEEEAGPPFPVP